MLFSLLSDAGRFPARIRKRPGYPLPAFSSCDQSRATHMAMPIPPPIQRVVSPFLASRRCISYSSVVSRSEEHTSELQSLMRISYAVFCLKTNKTLTHQQHLSTYTATH